ncbi:MAG: PAS domain S-box protein [Nocardioides marinisabuli]|uniref:PAS domain S-box protein n=1 Tax=Nocardioides marinisabuli TaxID=419476 RepID=UPI00321A9EB7
MSGREGRDDEGVGVRASGAETAAANNEMLRATLDAVPDAVIVVGEDGVITAANTQVEPVFGWRPEELEGQRIEVLVPPRLRATHPQRRDGYSHRPMGLLQLPAYRRDGVEFPAEISLASVPLGERRLAVATVRDITERLRLEAEADRLRDELLATVTHELRTPLTSIIGYAELLDELEQDALTPLGRDMLEKIRSNADRELRLVTDLLTMAVGNSTRSGCGCRTSTCWHWPARSSPSAAARPAARGWPCTCGAAPRPSPRSGATGTDSPRSSTTSSATP